MFDIALAEEERAPRGLCGGIGGGGGSDCDELRGFRWGGWDWDRDDSLGRSRGGGGGTNGGGLGGTVGETEEGEVLIGVFGGRGGTAGCCSLGSTGA